MMEQLIYIPVLIFLKVPRMESSGSEETGLVLVLNSTARPRCPRLVQSGLIYTGLTVL